MNKRIGNLEFRPASYLLPKDKWPEKPAYHIDIWYPNGYYGREKDFIEDGEFYLYPDMPNCRIHKDCFKSKESCMAIASFNYNEHEEFYELSFVGDRPIHYLDTPELREDFFELIQYGNKVLNE